MKEYEWIWYIYIYISYIYHIYIYHIYISYIYISYIYHIYTTFLGVACPGEDVAEARKMATAGRATESDWLQGLQGSVPGRGCTRECLKNLEDVRKIILDICSTLFDTFRVDLQSNLTWALITWSILIPCANVNCCWASLFLVFQTCKWAWIVLFDAVCFGQSFRRITGWSVKHVAALQYWDLPFLSLELQVKRGLYDELPQKTRHIIESCWETQVGGKAMPAVHVHRLRGTLCICNHAGEISKHIPRLFPKQGNVL